MYISSVLNYNKAAKHNIQTVSVCFFLSSVIYITTFQKHYLTMKLYLISAEHIEVVERKKTQFITFYYIKQSNLKP